MDPGTGHRWCAYPDGTCPSGYRYSDIQVGDNVSGMCVPGMDAGVDAKPGEADIVLGQEDFTGMSPNHGASGDRITAQSMYLPAGIAIDSATGSIWVADSANTRVLGWRPAPIASFAAATVVVGQQTFDARDGDIVSISRWTTLDLNVGLAAGGDKLLVPNIHSSRVLVFGPTPVANLPNASLVLGQADFASSKTGSGASDFAGPSAVWTDGARVAVTDTFNNRVLIWSSFPTRNGQPANVVLGQLDFGMSAFPDTPSASSLHYPDGVYSDGTRLYVSDTQNNRVLIWNSFPTVNGQAADVVLGQSTFATSNSGTSDITLREPRGIAVAGNTLFIADWGNNRVLAYSPIPTRAGASAKYVIGQPDLMSGTAGVTRSLLHAPHYLAAQGRELYVSDSANHRVMRFRLQ